MGVGEGKERGGEWDEVGKERKGRGKEGMEWTGRGQSLVLAYTP